MATRQRFHFAVFSAAIDRANGVDHVLCGQASAGSDYSFSCWQASNLAHDLPAFGEYCGPTGSVNGAIYSASAQKG
jgi:hypothetical protein